MANKHSLWNPIDPHEDAEKFNRWEQELKKMRKHAGFEEDD